MSTSVGQTVSRLALTCKVPPTPPRTVDSIVLPRSAEEAARLRLAPHGAKRLSERRLRVGWVGGSHIFGDKPPYDEPMAGVQWAYCAYSPTLNLHLLLKADGSVFTGALLDDRTGQLLPGGQKVLFSPDQQYYVAYEQPDGQDGETLKLYTRSGTKLWEGYDGILASDGTSVVANFEDLRWDAQNRPQATVSLEKGRTVALTLTQSSDGKWEWLPRLVCRFERTAGKATLHCE